MAAAPFHEPLNQLVNGTPAKSPGNDDVGSAFDADPPPPLLQGRRHNNCDVERTGNSARGHQRQQPLCNDHLTQCVKWLHWFIPTSHNINLRSARMDVSSNTASTDPSSGRSKAVRMNVGFSLAPSSRDMADSGCASPQSADNRADTVCQSIEREGIACPLRKFLFTEPGFLEDITPSSSARTRSRRRYPGTPSTVKPELNDCPRHLRQASPGKRQ